jgi:signal transduction histidine kinase
MVRVMAEPRFRQAEFVEIVLPDAQLKAQLVSNMGRLVGVTIFVAGLAGGLIYLSLNFLLVRPMQRITQAMERFRADPEDPAARVVVSRRRDEIGRAERELDMMQTDLITALQAKARLAALGEAVAKINHDLRNMLTSAQMASDRLAALGDPKVAQALPRLERALDRAITLASDVMAYGKSKEPAPALRTTPLRAALDMAAEDAGLLPSGVALETVIDGREQVIADPDQLHRILTNLLRNAREAIEGAPDRGGKGRVFVELRRAEGLSVLRLSDDGPGVPEKARNNLFQPFVGSVRRGGTGLGLAIARELAQGHGGDLALVETGPGRLGVRPDPGGHARASARGSAGAGETEGQVQAVAPAGTPPPSRDCVARHLPRFTGEEDTAQTFSSPHRGGGGAMRMRIDGGGVPPVRTATAPWPRPRAGDRPRLPARRPAARSRRAGPRSRSGRS